MDKKKKSPASAKTGLKKEGDMLIDSDKRVAFSSDLVNIVASLIEYHRLSEKLYKGKLEVK